jgi:hypothetical protein
MPVDFHSFIASFVNTPADTSAVVLPRGYARSNRYAVGKLVYEIFEKEAYRYTEEYKEELRELTLFYIEVLKKVK